MEKERDQIPEWMNALIDETLQEIPQNPLPKDFTEKVMAKLEKRTYLQEIVQEASLKALVVAGLILVLLTSLLSAGFISFEQITDFVLIHARIITLLSSVLLFTWLFNDVLLKYLFIYKRRSENLIQ